MKPGRFPYQPSAGDYPALEGVKVLFYCIGAHKSGTTWLFDQYKSHKEVHTTRKEFSYWNGIRPPYYSTAAVPIEPVIRRIRASRHWVSPLARRMGFHASRAALAWDAVLSDPDDHTAYTELLTLRRGDAPVVGDISPAYSVLYRRTFAEMAALHPDTRFIYLMRDPVRRLWSSARFRTRYWKRVENSADLVLAEFQRMLDDPQHPEARRSRYELTIAELEAGVPGEQIAYFFFEDFFSQESVDRLCSFLSIRSFAPDLKSKSNTGAEYGVWPTQDQLDTAHELFEPTYAAIAERFGDQVPKSWSCRMEAGSRDRQASSTAKRSDGH